MSLFMDTHASIYQYMSKSQYSTSYWYYAAICKLWMIEFIVIEFMIGSFTRDI